MNISPKKLSLLNCQLLFFIFQKKGADIPSRLAVSPFRQDRDRGENSLDFDGTRQRKRDASFRRIADLFSFRRKNSSRTSASAYTCADQCAFSASSNRTYRSTKSRATSYDGGITFLRGFRNCAVWFG